MVPLSLMMSTCIFYFNFANIMHIYRCGKRTYIYYKTRDGMINVKTGEMGVHITITSMREEEKKK